MVVLGYLGVFLGKLIKAAINRQREFLADASAVQFTRYPGGIASALKKIGGLSQASRIRDGHAQEISHMFFADAFAGSFFNLLATHPPLEGANSRVGARVRRPFSRGRAPGHRGRGGRSSVPGGPAGPFENAPTVADRRRVHGHGDGCRKNRPAHWPAADAAPGTCGPDSGPVAAFAVGGRPRTTGRPGARSTRSC